MESVWIFIGVGLLLLGIILACSTGRSDPPLPPTRTTQHTGNRLPPRRDVPQTTSALPPRRQSPTQTRATAAVGTALGPRGVRPSQFPCCPICRARNVPGSQQVIFWDPRQERFHCPMQHRFGANGRLL